MSYTKRQFVTAAFDEMGMADYAFDLAPEQLDTAVRRLDGMMAQWNAQGMRLGYPLPSSPQYTDIDAETDVPDSAIEAITLNLAVRLSPSYGKTPHPETKQNAKLAYRDAARHLAFPDEMQIPGGYPMGAGTKNTSGVHSPFTQPPVDPTIDIPVDEIGFD